MGETLIRTLIVDDLQLMRAALVALLAKEPDIEVISDVQCGVPVLPLVRRTQPDVVVIGIDQPRSAGLPTACQLHESAPEVRTLILTAVSRPASIKQILATGATGYVTKSAAPENLVQGIRRVARGQRVVDPELAVAVFGVADYSLTPQELSILQIAAEGASASEIAARAYLSVGTVRNYLSRIVRKTGARNRVDAIRIASDAGWL